MKNILKVLFVLLAFAGIAEAQAPSAYPYAKLIPNDTATGTTQFKLVKINSSGNAVIMATSDTNGYAGVCVANCGTSGSAWIAFAGLIPVVMDATATIQHYAQISSSSGGQGHDTGAITLPTGGGSVVGRVQTGCSGAACTAMVDLFPPEDFGASTPSSTDSLTNKTLDAEGTGNTLTLPFKMWLPAAGCNNTTPGSFWDLPTSTPAVAACVTGSNIQKGVLQYADTSGGFSAQTTLILPADFSGNIDARIIWRTSAITGNAKFSLSTICTDVAATATDDPAFNTASTVTTAAPGTTLRIQSSSITSVTVTGCAAGNLLHLKLFRDGNDAADTISASLDVIGVELTVRRAM